MPPRQPTCCQIVAPRKRNASIRLQDPIRQGELLNDINKKTWKLGRPLGVGAFGDIYLASDDLSRPVGGDAKYVVKVEPHTNGPLFVEMHFYLRACKEELLDEWKGKKHIKYLGVPSFFGFGSHSYRGERYRFLVLPRFGDNIQKLLLKYSKRFHVKTAFTLASHILDALEFIHSRGYIHCDIKGMNMVLGEGDSKAPVYLLDYGLVSRYTLPDGTHKEYDPDRRKAEAGTLEFSSRDAHIGALTRRSDLESLGYNLVQWLHGTLPWENSINSETVAELKDKAMSNVKNFLSSALPNQKSADALFKYMSYVATLEYNTKPDYTYCKKIFSQAIREAGFLDDMKLTFDSHAILPPKSRKRAAESENIPIPKRKKMNSASGRRPCSVFNHNVSVRVTRNLDKGPKLRFKEFDWAIVLASHPERPDLKTKEKKERLRGSDHLMQKCDSVPRSQSLPSSDLSNPTPAMLKVMNKMKKRNSEPARKSKNNSANYATSLTPAMEEVIARKRLFSSRTLRSTSRRGLVTSFN